jgi:hypothetical protein
MRFAALAIVVLMAACSLLSEPKVDCEWDAATCEWATTAAADALPPGRANWVFSAGRGPATFVHVVVHACYADGRYLAVNVIGPDDLSRAQVSVPYAPPIDPPCR